MACNTGLSFSYWQPGTYAVGPTVEFDPLAKTANNQDLKYGDVITLGMMVNTVIDKYQERSVLAYTGDSSQYFKASKGSYTQGVSSQFIIDKVDANPLSYRGQTIGHGDSVYVTMLDKNPCGFRVVTMDGRCPMYVYSYKPSDVSGGKEDRKYFEWTIYNKDLTTTKKGHKLRYGMLLLLDNANAKPSCAARALDTVLSFAANHRRSVDMGTSTMSPNGYNPYLLYALDASGSVPVYPDSSGPTTPDCSACVGGMCDADGMCTCSNLGDKPHWSESTNSWTCSQAETDCRNGAPPSTTNCASCNAEGRCRDLTFPTCNQSTGKYECGTPAVPWWMFIIMVIMIAVVGFLLFS